MRKITLPYSKSSQLRNEYIPVFFYSDERINEGVKLTIEAPEFNFIAETVCSYLISIDQIQEFMSRNIAGQSKEEFKETILKFYEGKVPGIRLSLFHYLLVKKVTIAQNKSLF